MNAKEVVVLSDTYRVGSLGWRHLLTWRQLSMLWQVPISTRLMSQDFTTENAACYSTVICRWEDVPHIDGLNLPCVVFLNGSGCEMSARPRTIVKEQQYRDGDENRIQHLFRVEARNPLGRDLPERVTIYGSCPPVTPLNVSAGMDVIVSLNDMPVILSHGRVLFIGADPWQFGAPSVPMLYKVLLNWLVHEARLDVRTMAPCAAVRLDDLPATAEHFRINSHSVERVDRARARVISRLRRFAIRTGSKFTLMYSSHFVSNGTVTAIAEVMPRSIRQMQRGVRQQAFEIGSHGMVHLRNPSDSVDPDPREFLDLDIDATAEHLNVCDREIVRLFGVQPVSFVAPAWGYRPGVTKEVAKHRYSGLIDSSQNVEAGKCDLLFSIAKSGQCLNVVETFRPGDQVLAYSSPEFWKCYAAAGIPVHYMQHSPTNWYVFRNILRGASCGSSRMKNVRSRLVTYTDNFSKPTYVRLISAVLLALLVALEDPNSRRLLRRVLTHSSLYAIVRAIKAGSYQCITVNHLAMMAKEFTGAHDVTVDALRGREADSMSA
jgi:hypothetical protein